MSMRPPAELDRLIEQHKTLLGQEPRLISLRSEYRDLHKAYFNNRIHALCCGKGYLYSGLPLVITSSAFCEDFLIGY
jgi:hypothetical protein